MKELLLQYAAYHAWANSQLLPFIAALPEETHKAEAKSSFPTLQATVLHLLDAESIWWQRLKLQERIVLPSGTSHITLPEAAKQLQQLNKQWHNWIAAAPEHALQHVFHYYNTKRELFKQPVYEVAMQVFNHGTYHRGQLVSQLRQLGIDKIPGTDFIIWSRKQR